MSLAVVIGKRFWLLNLNYCKYSNFFAKGGCLRGLVVCDAAMQRFKKSIIDYIPIEFDIHGFTII